MFAGTNELFPGNFICTDSDPIDGTHWIIYYWAVILVIESILLSGTLEGMATPQSCPRQFPHARTNKRFSNIFLRASHHRLPAG
jgi:hypothetical protein